MADQASAKKHEDVEEPGISVLIAVDGSVHSDHAVNWYIHNLHRGDNRIVLLHVANPDMQPVYAIQGMAIPREEWEMMVNEFKVKVHEIREKYIHRLEKAHIISISVTPRHVIQYVEVPVPSPDKGGGFARCVSMHWQ